MRKMQQRKRNVLRKKTGRLSVLFDEREWGGSQRQEDWQARSGLWKRRCNGVDNDLAGLGCEGSAVLDQGLHFNPFDLPATQPPMVVARRSPPSPHFCVPSSDVERHVVV
jgi:hypothetical protein